ncbi:MAG: AAA family ATPase, partial [Acidimicrobiales bacterium]
MPATWSLPVPYLPRVVDAELDARLAAAGAVVIEGPKASGKTETARQRAASSVLLDVDENARRAAAVDPSLVLEGPAPRLIDEWQVEPGLWNHVRRAVDDSGIPGQFILTGSSVPADDVARHTGAGRFSFLRMR